METKNISIYDIKEIQNDQITIFEEFKNIFQKFDISKFSNKISKIWLDKLLLWDGDTNVEKDGKLTLLFETW